MDCSSVLCEKKKRKWQKLVQEGEEGEEEDM